MSFDVDQTAAALAVEDDGTVVEILNENDEPALDASGKPVTITVAGMNSQRYRKATIWQTKAIRALSRKLSGEESLKFQSEFVARCVIAWSGFTSKGDALPFSVEAITDAFTKLPFVQRQVELAMGDRSRFFAKSSST